MRVSVSDGLYYEMTHGSHFEKKKIELIPLESSTLNIIEFDLIFHIDIFHGAMVD